MKITLKTLQQTSFVIDIDENETIRKLKEKVQEVKGSQFNADWLKLIYSGKILTDDAVVKDCGFEESRFIVVMSIKPKTSQPETNTATKVETNQPVVEAKSESIPKSTDPPKDDASTSQPTPVVPESAPNISTAESNVVVGEDYDRIVLQIMEMGYDKVSVMRALRASFNNPDRAVEYLISGIPDMPNEESPATESAPQPPPSSEAVSDTNPLEFLRSQPQFQQMRQVVQSNPTLLNLLIQQIGRNNPQLLQLITQNQEAFLRMLNEPSGNSPAQARPTPQENPPADVQAAATAAAAALPAGQPNIESMIGSAEINQHDKEAIDRLKALGFPEYLVVQAYFACDKNENMAANFLLSQGFDD